MVPTYAAVSLRSAILWASSLLLSGRVSRCPDYFCLSYAAGVSEVDYTLGHVLFAVRPGTRKPGLLLPGYADVSRAQLYAGPGHVYFSHGCCEVLMAFFHATPLFLRWATLPFPNYAGV